MSIRLSRDKVAQLHELFEDIIDDLRENAEEWIALAGGDTQDHAKKLDERVDGYWNKLRELMPDE